MSTFDSTEVKRTSSPSAARRRRRDARCRRSRGRAGRAARSVSFSPVEPSSRIRAVRPSASEPPRSVQPSASIETSPSTRMSQPMAPRPVISRSPPISSSEACSAHDDEAHGLGEGLLQRARAQRDGERGLVEPVRRRASRLDGHQQRDGLAQRGRGLRPEHLDLLRGVRGRLLERAGGIGEVAASPRATPPAPARVAGPCLPRPRSSWSIS